jgi:hypothetical protein
MNKGISAFWQYENKLEVSPDKNLPKREIWNIYDLEDNRLEKAEIF